MQTKEQVINEAKQIAAITVSGVTVYEDSVVGWTYSKETPYLSEGSTYYYISVNQVIYERKVGKRDIR